MKRQVHISDHALLRYLERILEIDIDAIRARLSHEIKTAAMLGAKKYTSAGATFVLEKTQAGDITVVTVMTEKMRSSSHGQRKATRTKKPCGRPPDRSS